MTDITQLLQLISHFKSKHRSLIQYHKVAIKIYRDNIAIHMEKNTAIHTESTLLVDLFNEKNLL